jgi:D-amino-acid dehydrogenase
MHVVVIGAGVTGLLTAWYLRNDGHDVTVLEANRGPAEGASFANGAQLSYSYVAPLAGPGVLPKIPPWLFRRDAPLRFQPSFDWNQWRWLARFLRACNARQSEITTRRLLRLAFYSRELMRRFLASQAGQGLRFGHSTNGKLVVYSDVKSFAAAQGLAQFQRTLGCEQRVLDADRCMEVEPALADARSSLRRRLVGAIHTPSEEVGDCYAFCIGLERLLHAAGVKFEYSFEVQDLRRARESSRTLNCARSCSSEVGADVFVVASGSASARLVRRLGIDLPIYPLKGYSLTVPAGPLAPVISVTDFQKKVVYAPLAGAPYPGAATEQRLLRVAGLADLVGHREAVDAGRFSVLLDEARKAFPSASEDAWAPRNGVMPWSGLRPATPLGTPILGRTAVNNLFLNTGHGALGWTLAHACARMVSDLVCNRPTEVALDGFTL